MKEGNSVEIVCSGEGLLVEIGDREPKIGSLNNIKYASYAKSSRLIQDLQAILKYSPQLNSLRELFTQGLQKYPSDNNYTSPQVLRQDVRHRLLAILKYFALSISDLSRQVCDVYIYIP